MNTTGSRILRGWVATMFILSLVGCSHPLKKYGIKSMEPFPISKEGYYVIPGKIGSSTPFEYFDTNRPIRLRGVAIDDSVFTDTNVLAGSLSLLHLLKDGSDSIEIYYRNYLTSCCDGWSAGSFVVLLRRTSTGYDLSRSFITEFGSLSPPHYVWYPRSVTKSEDSTLNIIAFPSKADSLHPYWFEIWHRGEYDSTLQDYKKTLNDMKEIAGDKYE